MARLLYFIFVQLKRWWCDWNWLITICFDNDTYYTELFQGFENEKEVSWHSSIVLNYTYLVFIYIRSNLLWKKERGKGSQNSVNKHLLPLLQPDYEMTLNMKDLPH